jgi:hypothetical protein
VLWIYRATDDRKGTQIIFSDSGVPKAKQRGEFDVYNYIRDLKGRRNKLKSSMNKECSDLW